MSLTQRVALLSLVPIVALGFILSHVLQTQIVSRTLADASQSAQLIAHIGIQPRLSQRSLREGLGPSGVGALDRALSGRLVTQNLARIKIWNAHDEVIYSDLHNVIGHTYTPSDELARALAGRPPSPRVISPKPGQEEGSEVGLGQLVEVYVPLRLAPSGPPDGAFEIYLHYRPIAAAVSSDKRTIALVVAIGLAVLWAILFRIVAGAARRLRRQSEENYRLAHYDKLTGLPNRTLFIERVARALRVKTSEPGAPAVLLIDLDGFKEINNTLGGSSGDRVLCEVAQRLRDAVGGGSLVARMGGDEYAVLARTEGVAGALALTASVHSSLESPIPLDDVAVNVEASTGIAVMGAHADDLDTLLQGAASALARAKSHHSRLEVFSPELDTFDQDRLVLLGEVRAALERNEFILHYQPKVELESGRITGVEALLRWQHPDRGLLAPHAFIPLIEQTALITPLTLYVFTQALRQLGAWRELGLDLGMSVNVSARSLLDPDLTSLLAGLLRSHHTPPPKLTVEVTESATVSDPDRAAEVLRGLRAVGVGISIDDFGTGNASIAYLTRLPATEIKIDKSLITGICEDERAQAIVRSTIELARQLDLHVVAEGVETQAVLDRLRELGCDTAQGYLLSRPEPAEQLSERLRRQLLAAPAESRSAPLIEHRRHRRAPLAGTLD